MGLIGLKVRTQLVLHITVAAVAIISSQALPILTPIVHVQHALPPFFHV
jgi:hypothetical protein